MSTTFLCQEEFETLPAGLGKVSLISGDVATVMELAKAENEWAGEDKWAIARMNLKGLRRLDPAFLSSLIPVGSLEYTATAYGLIKNLPPEISALHPIHVPDCMARQWPLARRAIYRNLTEEEVSSFGSAFGKVFLKDADRYKSEVTGIYKKNDHFPHAKHYFLSEVLPDIQSEWRVFVYRNEVQDIRRYIGSPYSAPPREGWVKDAIEAYKDEAPPAYTLDVAILENGNEAVIEVHPFISCGLYGFEGSRILPMLREAWQWQLSQTLPEKRDTKI